MAVWLRTQTVLCIVAPLLVSIVECRESDAGGYRALNSSGSTPRLRVVTDSGVVRVVVPERTCDPRQHGAVGDGRTDDTLPIQRALDQCGQAGGGTVVLGCAPSQRRCTFTTFPLQITGNHTELHVDTSATLRFSSARNDTRWQGVGAGKHIHRTGMAYICHTGSARGNASYFALERTLRACSAPERSTFVSVRSRRQAAAFSYCFCVC